MAEHFKRESVAVMGRVIAGLIVFAVAKMIFKW
jgi:hypothetical protein